MRSVKTQLHLPVNVSHRQAPDLKLLAKNRSKTRAIFRFFLEPFQGYEKVAGGARWRCCLGEVAGRSANGLACVPIAVKAIDPDRAIGPASDPGLCSIWQ